MKTNKEIEKIPVVIFALQERTVELCRLSFEKLGFKNIIIMDRNIGFSEKMLAFFKLINDSEENLFLRTDADRIALPGIIEFCDMSIRDYGKIELLKDKKKFFITEGLGYECFLSRKRYRAATPHIYSREVMKYCIDNEDDMIKNVQKPESFIGGYFKKNHNALKNYEILTNIHEIEQYPSKMYQAFLNRILRGHLSYYNLEEILNDKIYGYAMQKAISDSRQLAYQNKNKSMNYHNLELTDDRLLSLDKNLGKIKDQNKIIDNLMNRFKR